MQPPSAMATESIISSVNGIDHHTNSASPPSIMSTSTSSTSSSSPSHSSMSSTPLSNDSSVNNMLLPMSQSSNGSMFSSSTPTTSSPSPSTPTTSAVAAAAAAAQMITPLRELNNYLAKLEEDKGKMRDENSQLHDVNDRLHTDLVTYSRFNCVLENIRRSFDKGFTALQCVDQNKACRCNEHLNTNLRRIVHEAEIELALWQKHYDKLVYKYQSENGSNNSEYGSPTALMDNPLRHLNAALIGANGTLVCPPSMDGATAEMLSSAKVNGFNESTVELMNGTSHHRSHHHSSSFNQHRQQSIAKPTPLSKIAESSQSAEPDQCHKLSKGGPDSCSSQVANSSLQNGLCPQATSKQSNAIITNGSSVLKSSYDLSAAINFSTSSFLKPSHDKSKSSSYGQHLTNGHHRHHMTHRATIELDDEEPITPPPLIPPPPPPTFESTTSKRINGESIANPWNLRNGHSDLKDRRVVSEALLHLKQSEENLRKLILSDTESVDSAKGASEAENAVQLVEKCSSVKSIKLEGELDKENVSANKENENKLSRKESKVMDTDDEQMNQELNAIAKSVESKSDLDSGKGKTDDETDEEMKEVKKDKDVKDGDSEMSTSSESGQFVCEWPECNQMFDSDEILTMHRRCHIRKSNYLCKHCSARMLSREELEQHVAKCEQTSKSERKQSFSKSRTSPDPNSNASSGSNTQDELKIVENGTSGDRSGSNSPVAVKAAAAGPKSKSESDSAKRNYDAHSSEEEIEVEEVSVLKYNRGGVSAFVPGSELHLHHLKSSPLDGAGKEDMLLNGEAFLKQTSNSRRGSNGSVGDMDLATYARYSDLLYPSKRQKAFTISTPSYLPSHHLASLSAFYPHLAGQNGMPNSGSLSPHHPLMAGHPPGINPIELSALMESGRISPLTLSMLAQQHQQNQHRFQQYFAAAAAQHHMQQSSGQPGAGNGAASPPPSPPGAENLTLPNSVRSSSFSTASNGGSPFYHRTSSISSLMGPPAHSVPSSGKQHPSGRILSAALSPSQPSDRLSTSSPGSNVLNGYGSHHHTSSPSHQLFSPQSNGATNGGPLGPQIIPRSYTIGTPGSFSALAALAAAATSSAPTSTANTSSSDRSNHLNFGLNGSSANGGASHLASQLHSSQALASKSFGSPFVDLPAHHRNSNSGSRHSPLGSPVSSNGSMHSVNSITTVSSPQSMHHRNLIYGPAGGPQSQSGLGPLQLNGSSVSPNSHHHLLNSTSSQGQLAMIAAAAAAAADNARHAQLPSQLSLASGNEASRLTAAALANMGALKHPALAGMGGGAPGPGGVPPPPNGEYKRTRYSGIGRYRCPWPDCGYTPHFLRDLRRHMFKHTGDKKHKCDYPGCDFVSVWKTSLLQHQRKKHYGVSSAIQLRTNNHHRVANANANGTTNGNPVPNGVIHNGNGPAPEGRVSHSPHSDRVNGSI